MSKTKRALGFKQLACKVCGEIVDKVDEKADAITCSACVQRELAGPLWISEEDYFKELAARLADEEEE